MAKNNLESLSSIFNNKIFRIPDYQRGYAWGEPQLKDFWSDLEHLDDKRIHYTGMITVENINDDFYYIIDGQQRFTSIMILIKVLLDKINQDWIQDEEKSDQIKKYLFKRTGKEGKNIKVIFGYEKDNPSDCFYKTKILNLDDSESYHHLSDTLYTRNLAFAKNFFEEKLIKFSEHDLTILFRKITKQLKFNFYELDDELDEFVTFETMNNRGKPLTTLELLKNRLIYLTTLLKDNSEDEIEALRKDINNSWKTIYEYLGKNLNNIIDDDTFLKDHWIMYFTYDRGSADVEKDFLLNKHFTQQKILMKFRSDFDEVDKLLKSSKKNIKDFYIDYDDIWNYVMNIQKSVIEYYYLHNPLESSYDKDVQKWLSKLNRVSFGAFKPLIMAILVQKSDSKKIVEILEMAEKYVFLVFTISSKRGHTGNSRIYGYAHQFHNTKNIEDLIQNIRNELFDDNGDYKWVDLKSFENDINNLFKDSNGWYDWKGLKYLLYEYELFLQGEVKGETKLQWEEINKDSIEHIYPQTPKDECWTKDFKNLTKKEKARYTNSLGNLVLLSSSKNSKLQNNCFNKINYDKVNKKDAFSTGSYSEIEVSKNEVWTPNEIIIRGEKILEFLSTRWLIEIPQETIENIL